MCVLCHRLLGLLGKRGTSESGSVCHGAPHRRRRPGLGHAGHRSCRLCSLTGALHVSPLTLPTPGPARGSPRGRLPAPPRADKLLAAPRSTFSLLTAYSEACVEGGGLAPTRSLIRYASAGSCVEPFRPEPAARQARRARAPAHERAMLRPVGRRSVRRCQRVACGRVARLDREGG